MPIQKPGCSHDMLTDLNGNVISPRIHYGDGADEMVECLRCKTYYARKVKGRIVPMTESD